VVSLFVSTTFADLESIRFPRLPSRFLEWRFLCSSSPASAGPTLSTSATPRRLLPVAMSGYFLFLRPSGNMLCVLQDYHPPFFLIFSLRKRFCTFPVFPLFARAPPAELFEPPIHARNPRDRVSVYTFVWVFFFFFSIGRLGYAP